MRIFACAADVKKATDGVSTYTLIEMENDGHVIDKLDMTYMIFVHGRINVGKVATEGSVDEKAWRDREVLCAWERCKKPTVTPGNHDQ